MPGRSLWLAGLVLFFQLSACSGGGSQPGTGSGLSINPTSLDFRGVQGGSTPPAQTIQIDISDPNAFYVVAGVPAGSTLPSWLDMTLSGSGAIWTLSLQVVTTNLTPAAYPATVRVATARRDETVIGYRDAQVTYTVAVGLTPSTSAVNFNHVFGAPAPSTQVVDVAGTPGVTWTASADQPWVKLGNASGSTPGKVTIGIDPAALDPSTYAATVTLKSATGDATATIGVALRIVDPTLAATPAGISLGGPDGEDTSSAAVQLSLDTGTNAYPWSVSTLTDWIQISPSASSVSATPATVTISPMTLGVAGGDFSGSIVFTANVQGRSVVREVPVTLRVKPHRLFVHDEGVALLSSPTLSRLSRNVTVRENRGQPVSWTAASDQNWLSVVTASGTTGESLVVTADPSNLAAEAIHYANVTISSTDPTIVNSGQEIVRVGLYVTQTAPLEPAVTTLVNPEKATGIATDPVRPYVYVTHGGAAADVYNVHTGALAATISNPGSDLRALTISRDGSRLYAVDHARLGIVVFDLTASPPVVETTWSNPVWSNCSRCDGPFLLTDLDFTRTNGRPVLVVGGPEVIDALTGDRLFPSPVSFFASASLAEVGGDGRTIFFANTDSEPHFVSRYVLRYDELADTVTVARSSSAMKDSFARGLSADYTGETVYRACWYPDQIESYSGADLSTVSSIPNGTNGGALLGPDGLVYCSRYYSEVSAPGVPDLWAWDPQTGSLAAGHEYTVAGEIGERQLAISGDGLRLVTRSNDLTVLTSTTVVH